MRNRIFILALSSMLAFACKPTPRTAVEAARKDSATPPSATPVEAETEQAAAKAEQPVEQQIGLLDIASTRQDYNYARPWEKKSPNTGEFKGVYLGGGRVLTVGRAARSATYVEIRLPDHSRMVPAKVLKFDNELDLALLTVEHPEDASVFDGLAELPVGEPLSTGESAELYSLTSNFTPQRVGVEVESVNEDESLPRLELRAERPVHMEAGLPILKDGRLVALVDEHESREQSLTCINAEFISRLLDDSTASGNDVPVIGVEFVHLDDPVFSKYLKIDPQQGGVYVSKVYPGGAAQAVGIRKGDVVISIEGLPLDKLGRCKHPIYGLMDAPHVIRSLKPVGQQIRLTISRDGVQQEVSVPLNRDAAEKSLLGQEKPGEAPRYIVWGGLVFQPLTESLLQGRNNMNLYLLELKDRAEELLAEGRQEIVGLTLVIPTPATLSYDGLDFAMVEQVNGKRVHSFAEFAELLDAPTEDGLTELTLNRPPYTIYLDRQAVEASNDMIRRRAIPRLRQLGSEEAK